MVLKSIYLKGVSEMVNYDWESMRTPPYLDENTAARMTREMGLDNPRKAPPTATESMTEATLTGADVAGQQYAQQKQQAAIMDNVTRRLAQGLLGSKAAYEQGQTLYNNAENEQQAMAGQLLMDKAAQQANSIRQSAGAAGLDLSRFGENMSYQQASQAMQDDTLRGLANIFRQGDMTSDDYYNQQYQALRAKHYTEKQARDEAARRAGRYQAERMGKLTNAFNNYGLNEDGVINNDGVRILNMMAGEDEKAANTYAQMYANPKNAYAAQNARDIADIGFQRQLALADRRLQNQMGMAEYRAALKSGNGGNGDMTQKAMLGQYYMEGLDIFDGDREQAQRYAYEKVNQIKSSGKPTRGNSNDKYDGYDKKTSENLNNLRVELDDILSEIQKGLQSKDSSTKKEIGELTGDRLEPLQKQINLLELYLTEEDWAQLQEFKDNVESMRNRLIGVNPKNLTGKE